MLNKFKDNMKENIDNLDKKSNDYLNIFNDKISTLNDKISKIKDTIKNNKTLTNAEKNELLDLNGLDRNGNNINSIKGTRKKYPKRKINYSDHDDGILYDQYGFNSQKLNKDGYDVYGFDKNGLNKDGYDMYGFKEKSSKIKTSKAKSFKDQKGKEYIDLPILLSKLNINSSKELISNIEQLINNLYNNKQITKQVYNILNKAITYKNDP